jgi:hypothetical protein
MPGIYATASDERSRHGVFVLGVRASQSQSAVVRSPECHGAAPVCSASGTNAPSRHGRATHGPPRQAAKRAPSSTVAAGSESLGLRPPDEVPNPHRAGRNHGHMTSAALSNNRTNEQLRIAGVSLAALGYGDSLTIVVSPVRVLVSRFSRHPALRPFRGTPSDSCIASDKRASGPASGPCPLGTEAVAQTTPEGSASIGRWDNTYHARVIRHEIGTGDGLGPNFSRVPPTVPGTVSFPDVCATASTTSSRAGRDFSSSTVSGRRAAAPHVALAAMRAITM